MYYITVLLYMLAISSILILAIIYPAIILASLSISFALFTILVLLPIFMSLILVALPVILVLSIISDKLYRKKRTSKTTIERQKERFATGKIGIEKYEESIEREMKKEKKRTR